MGRAPCCDKANVKKGPWSPEEDAKLKAYIEQHGTGGNWIALPQKIGLRRCGKSCRLRWLNYLRPNIKHGGFSEEEDNIICSLYMSIGSRWSIIAAQLPGRTDNDIKNYWNTRLKKKLLGRQRKEHQARRASCFKQDQSKRELSGRSSFMVTAETMNVRDLYWTQLPVPVLSPTHNALDQLYQSDINTLTSSASMDGSTNSTALIQLPNTHYDLNGEAPDMFNGFPFELEESVFGGGVDDTLQLPFNGSTGTSFSAESTSMGTDMNSLLYYPPTISSYEANYNQQGMVQDYCVEESRYLGLQ